MTRSCCASRCWKRSRRMTTRWRSPRRPSARSSPPAAGAESTKAAASGATGLEQAAEEAASLLALGGDEDLGRRALLEDAALVEEGDLLGDLAGEAHLVGGDDHGHPLSLE